jgi:hypothetical protein
MNGRGETIESEKKRAQELAHSLVVEAWNLGAAPMTLTVEYEGATWEETVRVIASEGLVCPARVRHFPPHPRLSNCVIGGNNALVEVRSCVGKRQHAILRQSRVTGCMDQPRASSAVSMSVDPGQFSGQNSADIEVAANVVGLRQAAL